MRGPRLGRAGALQHRPRRLRQARPRDRLAMVWEDWQGNERRVNFGELQDLSNRFANVLEAMAWSARTASPRCCRRCPRSRPASWPPTRRGDPALDVGAVRRRLDRVPPQRLGGQGAGHLGRPPRPGAADGARSSTWWWWAAGRRELRGADRGGLDRFETPATDPDTPAQLYYTSGTTGLAKGILHAHRYLLGARGVPVQPRRPGGRAVPLDRRVGLDRRDRARHPRALALRGGDARPRRARAASTRARRCG